MSNVPDCFEVRTEGKVCDYHADKIYGHNDCWNLRDEHGEHPTEGQPS